MSTFLAIKEDVVEALKAHNEVKVSTLRFLISKLENAKIQKGQELTDEELLAEVAKDVKRHRESAVAFRSAGREELAKKEEEELAFLTKYLPQQISEQEVEKAVDAVIAETGATAISDMGRVMSAVMAKVGQSADGSVVSNLVRAKLSK